VYKVPPGRRDLPARESPPPIFLRGSSQPFRFLDAADLAETPLTGIEFRHEVGVVTQADNGNMPSLPHSTASRAARETLAGAQKS